MVYCIGSPHHFPDQAHNENVQIKTPEGVLSGYVLWYADDPVATGIAEATNAVRLFREHNVEVRRIVYHNDIPIFCTI